MAMTATRLHRALRQLRTTRVRLLSRIRGWGNRIAADTNSPKPPVGSEADLKNRFCAAPFEQFTIFDDGQVYQCCPTWLPPAAGNMLIHSADEVWNSPQAQRVRASILDGSFSYCDKKLCPHIQAGTLPTLAQARGNPVYRKIIDRKTTRVEGIPRFLNLCHDKSCNLSCPSCRVEKINFVRGEGYDRAKALQDKLVDAFFRTPSRQTFKVSITGTGDPFASRVFREFLCELDGSQFPNMDLNLQTNGVLFTPRVWQRIHKVHDNINTVLVSFDAATERTYNITRRGGQWDALLSNMEFIGQLRRDRKIRYLRLDFVVQDHNFREMGAFVGLARQFSADAAYFSRAVQWGTWTEQEYRERCVWEPYHRDHDEFMDMMSRPVFADKFVHLGNLSEFQRTAEVTSAP